MQFLRQATRAFVLAVLAAAMSLAGAGPAFGQDCPQPCGGSNLSFETGNFTNWVVQDVSGTLQVGGAGISAPGGGFVSEPTDGAFACLHGFMGSSGIIRIAQDFAIPAETNTLLFDYRASWVSGLPSVPPSTFSVNIEPAGGGPPLQKELILMPDVLVMPDTGDLVGTVDVGAFSGTTVRVVFEWMVSPAPISVGGFFQLDNIRCADVTDTDVDGVPDACDICPGFDDAPDADGDGVPDGCDVCPGFDDAPDADGDGVPDGCDVCPDLDDTADADGDGVPDDCDACPNDPDDDVDGDGVCGDVDPCPLDNPDDTDGDGVCDSDDNCPNHANAEQADCDRDGVGDVCVLATCAGEPVCDDCNGNAVPDGCDASADEEAKLTASDAAVSDGFGSSVSISGDRAVVGARVDNDAGSLSGSAYVFRRDDGGTPAVPSDDVWVEEAKLTASDAAAYDEFGSSVSISGDRAVVGAYRNDDAGSLSGSAYVFRRDDNGTPSDPSDDVWAEEVKLTASDAAADDRFGSSVSISGDRAVVGAYRNDDAGPFSGSAYVFSTAVYDPDGDGDDVPNSCDPCPFDNPDDTDGDGVCDSDDVCPSFDDTADADGDGVPDGCDVCPGFDDNADADSDGVPDACDVCPGFDDNADADSDGMPDGCDVCLGDDASGDTDSDGVCDSDDVCPGFDDNGPDADSDGVPDACQVWNQTQDAWYGTIGDAVGAAVDFDHLLAGALRFGEESNIDLAGKALTLESRGPINQPAGGSIILADDAVLEAAVGEDITLGGDVRLGVFQSADLICAALVVDQTGSLLLATASFATVQGPGGVTNHGAIDMVGSLLAEGGLHNAADGQLAASGFVGADVVNDNQATFNGDSYVVGDYANNGTTTIVNGLLRITGALTNSGQIIGDVSTEEAGGAEASAADLGLAASGDTVVGAGASLLMPATELTVQVEGSFDVAIDDNTNYDMAQATLQAIGPGAVPQTLEVMSEDLGPDPAGLDPTQPGHFPVGTLRIGPTPTTVDLVDNHDNDGLGQVACEAIYVDQLVIDAGATLNTNTCRIYYNQLTNNGTVDDPASLILIGCAVPALVRVAPSLGADAQSDVLVWPKSKHVGLGSVEIELNDAGTLITSCTSPAGAPTVDEMADSGEGVHTVQFGAPIPLGEWVTVELTVVNGCGNQSNLCFHVAHLPGDLDGNLQVNMNDANKFRDLFPNGALMLGDLNDDGQINLNDATVFGQVWNGTSGEGMAPDGTGGWSGQGLGAPPSCVCP